MHDMMIVPTWLSFYSRPGTESPTEYYQSSSEVSDEDESGTIYHIERLRIYTYIYIESISIHIYVDGWMDRDLMRY